MNNNFPDLDFQIDTSEFDADLEAQQIFLQKQYEERKQEEEKKIKELERIKSIDVIPTQDKITKIEQKAEYNSNIYLHSKYMHCYKSEIIDNDILGKCSLHYILGTFLRDKKIYRHAEKWIDYRIHMILIQISGSGKGETANFIDRIFTKIKFPVIDIHTHKLLPREQWRPVKKITSGIATPQSLADTYVMDKGAVKIDKNGLEIINKGSLSKYDVFIYEEGGHLFNNSPSSNDMTDAFLRAMEPIGSSNNRIDKKLTQYANALPTTSKSSLFFMTRPMGKMEKTVAGSGLFQRCLFIPREIEQEVIKNMRIDSGLNDLDYMCGAINKKDLEFYNDMIQEFFEVIEFAYNNEITIKPELRNEIKSFYTNIMQWFYDDMTNSITDDNVIYILSSLQNRYKDSLFIIAFHSACMRYSKYVDMEDFQYAFTLMKELYIEQKEWLFTSLKMDYREKRDNIDFKKELLTILKMDKNNLKTMDSIVKELSKIFDINYKVCYKKVINLTKGALPLIYLVGNDKNAKIRIV